MKQVAKVQSIKETKADANPPKELGSHALDNTGARALDSGFKAIVKTVMKPVAKAPNNQKMAQQSMAQQQEIVD